MSYQDLKIKDQSPPFSSDYRRAIRAFLCMPENAVRSADARASRASDEQETSSRQVAGQEKRGDPTVPNNTV